MGVPVMFVCNAGIVDASIVARFKASDRLNASLGAIVPLKADWFSLGSTLNLLGYVIVGGVRGSNTEAPSVGGNLKSTRRDS